MSQDEEKCELVQEVDAGSAASEKEAVADRDVIVRLSERFEIFTEQVIKKMDELLSMRDMVDQLLRRKTNKRNSDAERKRKERTATAKAKTGDRIVLKGSIFDVRMRLMREKYILWAHVGTQFGIMGS